MVFARWVFRVAALVGLLLLVPRYFTEQQVGVETPPAVTHPEYYYGFLGVAVAWQLAFLVIAADPARYRLMMLPGVVEKFSFGLAVLALYAQERVPRQMVLFGLLDLVWGVLFLVAFSQVGKQTTRSTSI